MKMSAQLPSYIEQRLSDLASASVSKYKIKDIRRKGKVGVMNTWSGEYRIYSCEEIFQDTERYSSLDWADRLYVARLVIQET